MPQHRFPPPWSVEEPDPKLGRQCYIVHDAKGRRWRLAVEIKELAAPGVPINRFWWFRSIPTLPGSYVQP
jgi:hypothetical protein